MKFKTVILCLKLLTCLILQRSFALFQLLSLLILFLNRALAHIRFLKFCYVTATQIIIEKLIYNSFPGLLSMQKLLHSLKNKSNEPYKISYSWSCLFMGHDAFHPNFSIFSSQTIIFILHIRNSIHRRKIYSHTLALYIYELIFHFQQALFFFSRIWFLCLR